MIPITACRLCKCAELERLFSLGEMAYTGIFPIISPGYEPAVMPTLRVPRGPLSLVKCIQCQLVQLEHQANPHVLYGKDYGYRSGLNQSMVAHLRTIALKAQEFVQLGTGDVVMDIGSNDGTLLSFMPEFATRMGVDPTANKFRQFYPQNSEIVPRFFHRDLLWRIHGTKARAKLVTSIAMFYDLPDPVEFARDVASILADDGAWILEVAYLPEMVRQNAFDGICHEHLEYYGLAQIERILGWAGLVIRDVSFNDTNGGSLQIVAMKHGEPFPCAGIIEGERRVGMEDADTFRLWHRKIEWTAMQLRTFLETEKAAGRRIFGYGASTKGNVLLQAAHINAELLPYIADINPDKWHHYTPGTGIPIISEEEAKRLKPDAFLVLPWHFRSGIIEREQDYLTAGGKLIFPLPQFEVVNGDKRVLGHFHETYRPRVFIPPTDYELGN